MEESLDARVLANYISGKYKEKYTSEISPLKLQKSLYFLFAEWGSFVARGQNYANSTEFDVSNFNKYLFNDEIKAWVYGPVIVSAYKTKLTDFNDFSSIKSNQFRKGFIDGLLKDLFRLTDFDLVDLSHEDIVWQKAFINNENAGNVELNKDEIIDEYIQKKEK